MLSPQVENKNNARINSKKKHTILYKFINNVFIFSDHANPFMTHLFSCSIFSLSEVAHLHRMAYLHEKYGTYFLHDIY